MKIQFSQQNGATPTDRGIFSIEVLATSSVFAFEAFRIPYFADLGCGYVIQFGFNPEQTERGGLCFAAQVPSRQKPTNHSETFEPIPNPILEL